MNDQHKEWFSGIDNIVNDPLRFKARLAIGEDAYTSLRVKNAAVDAWDAVGAGVTAAGVAKTSAVAATFFAPTGFLAAIGIGTAVTPIGWVAVAGILTGTAWLGITRYMKNTTSSRVTVIPNFINTPLDVLALGLFDLLTPLALKVAAYDGNIDQSVKDQIRSYFVDEWGYDRNFVNEGMNFTESHLSEFTVKEIAQTLADFKMQNPDCNYEAMSRGILGFLHNVMEADGRIDEREELAIEKVRSIFKETGKFSIKRTAKNYWGCATNAANKLYGKFGKSE